MDTDIETQMRQAHDAFRRGEFVDAQLKCEQVLHITPENARALIISGMCLQAQGKHREAVERFERAVALDPRLLRVYQSLGISLQILGQITKAAKSFLTAIELDPGDASNYLCLGKLLLERGYSPNAVDCGRDAVRIEPGSALNHVFLAQALARMGLAEEAESEFRQASALDPGNADFHRMLGFHLLASGASDGASRCLERSISLQPSQGLSYLGLVQIKKTAASERGLIDRIETVLHAEGLKPVDRSYLQYALGKGLDDLAEYETAMTHFEEANRLAYEERKFREPFRREAAEERATQAGRLFTRDTMEACRSVGNDTVLPILIVGMMRSGTTLVDQILSSHPEVGAAGEVPLWTTDGPKALDYRAGTISQAVLAGLSSQYLQLLRRISPGTRYVTDKMPGNFQMLGAINLGFPLAKIIHIKRNPADTCLSIYTTPYSVSPSFAHSKENIALAYTHYLRMMDLWRKVLPSGAMLEVEYEELVLEPERVTRDIIRFCGLGWSDACLVPERNARLVSTPSMLQVREPVYQSSVNRWKRYEPWLGPFKELLSESGPEH
jgi:tetratricopeptide (TPR) repeat protein